MEDVLERRADLMLIHKNSIHAIPYRDQFDITQLLDAPYLIACRKNHPVLASQRRLEDVIVYDWAVAGFDMTFEQSLPTDLSALLQAHGFPKYRLLSQAACLDMVRQSDILTLIPQISAPDLKPAEDFELFDFPLPLRFSVCAARLAHGPQDDLLDAFIAALATS